MSDAAGFLTVLGICFWLWMGFTAGCSPTSAQQPSATFNQPLTTAIQAVAEPVKPKGESPKESLSLTGLAAQIQRIENVQKAQLALTLIDTYGGACGRRFEGEEDQEHCQVTALSCAMKTMASGEVDMAALMKCGNNINE